MKARLPTNEEQRLAALDDYQILDTLPEQAYDDITFLASLLCDTPIALMSLVTRNRQWFKSAVGLEVRETPRDLAFCAHAILEPGDLTVVRDTHKDDRFSDNLLVTRDPTIRFYAGAPLTTEEGLPLGTLCVIDRVPRELTAIQKKALTALSRQVMAQLGLRLAAEASKRYARQLDEYQRQLEERNALLAKESLTDPLTNLGNRRAFDRTLSEEIGRSARYKMPLSVLLIDIDHFKRFNDEFGHTRGDTVLRELADLLERERRRGDFLARYGGEEFAAILPSTGREGAAVLAERFRRAVEGADWKGFPLTISIGIAHIGADEEASELVDAADRALYRAKKAGRNQIAE